jgi:adenylate cyclase
MVLYVVFAVPEYTMITCDYVAYLTSKNILLDAEFDKVISVVMVTAILAMTVTRARGLSRFFSPEVVHQITDAESEVAAGPGVEREAAVLNVDLRGFTIFSGEVEPTN